MWSATIETHRQEVRDAILEATARLVAEQGLLSVTMSGIADESGIGRATLYKYFPDVQSILLAWHEQMITSHLEHLEAIRSQPGTATERLAAVLHGYALLAHQARGHRDNELAAILHRDEHVARAEQQLRDLMRDLIEEAAAAGDVRDDVAAAELASYCLHALTAASTLPSKAAVHRLVEVTLAGLAP